MPTLSPEATQIIAEYLALPFSGRTVNTPYFNNQRSKVRAALRVLVGKGTPAEIVEEAHIISLRDKLDLTAFTDSELKKWLVEQNLGVDCSALAYYILQAEIHARGLGSLRKKMVFPGVTNIFRKLIVRLRPAENTDVTTLASDRNSHTVTLAKIAPGDMIILWRTGLEHKLNHVLIVHEVTGQHIFYTHTLRWSKEGKYDHGVRQGMITITDPNAPLVAQQWTEKKCVGVDNETWQHAQWAEKIELRRLHILATKKSSK